MDERTDGPQLELLAKIHNQLVDLTKLIAEVELSKTTSDSLKVKLQEISAKAEHIDGEGHSSVVEPRQQKVIAPTDLDIKPGEGRAEA